MGSLNDKKCAAKPTRPREYRHDHLNNLSLLVTVSPKGKIVRRWRFSYYRPGKRNKNGRGVRSDISLGIYDAMSLAEARARAAQCTALIRQGIDPAHHRASAEAQSSREQATLAAVSAAYVQWAGGTDRRPSTIERMERDHRAIEKTDIGRRPIGPLSKDLEGMERWARSLSEHRNAKKIVNYLGNVFDWAMDRGYCERNPARRAYKHLPKEPVESYRAVTDPADAGALMRAIRDDRNDIARTATEFLALTFVRPDNVWSAEWAHVDMDRRIWTVPAGMMKMDKAHAVPLSRQAITILTRMHSITGGRRFVFSTGGDRPVGHLTFTRLAQRIGWHTRHVAHGFRSMASTILNGDSDHAFWRHAAFDRSFCRQVIETQLAHGDADKIAAIYNRNDMMAIRAGLMQWWADRLDMMASGLRVVEAA